MSNRQAEIAAALDVVPPFADDAALSAEIERRKTFIKNTLKNSGLKVLVLGISGGVDSLTAGRLAQLSVEELRAETGDTAYRFVAVRLPHNAQHDEHDAQDSLKFICADEQDTVNIAGSVSGLGEQVTHLQKLSDARRDFVVGNIKARIRMVAQFAIANANNGLVIGTDHAAEAVMGFFTKFGDGACDLAPLSGLVKNQVRAIAKHLGAPQHLVMKTPTADLEELRPGKPDEEAHGVTYAEIDAFLHGEKVSDEAYATIVRTYDNTRHKRELPLVP
ncbi:ammonia-dependent NAD(+) synthetase [Pseudomonas sp. MDMC216]|jgi:NAD+ synthase|nr:MULTISPECIES: ammonia-dependent NAD(+) synthetase [Pseudomonas]KJU76979.1 NAD synthetase [Pseudomonas oleovorans]MBJ7547333.1 ammonia-dependent NAD(+) synthetase [Pseudomonas sp. OA3]KJU76983.1 NAD synthetase [Pseudomonas oleovorans]MBG0844439.1 ammonia-dependent NAD(+) synthetase [Pseudomonas chengduensis]MDH1562074.1 ammonia-dependent NAD(+) synthetase [Pseudomonas chengduensis]